MNDDELGAEYEALLQFVYMAPIGIVQLGNDGTVAMMNPTAAQLLLAIAPDGSLDNVFSVLDAVAPDLRGLVGDSVAAAGPLCQDLRVQLPAGGPGALAQRVLSVNLIRLDGARVMAVLSDVSEVARRERELREKEAWHKASLEMALEAANAADRAKTEFLANISHEFRTPMHAISNFARLGHGRSPDAPREKLQRYFENIDGSASRLNRLLTDLLDLSAIEAGKMRCSMARHDLHRVIGDVVGDCDAMAKGRGVQLEFDARAAQTILEIDDVRIKQVVVNLLSNAIKFSPQGGAATVVLTDGRDADGNDCLVVTVSDQGPGIPPDELDAVFDKFVQSSKTNTGAGGAGLGLAIAREIVKAHHGNIRAQNRPGGGAEFRMELPLVRPVAQVDSTDPLVA